MSYFDSHAHIGAPDLLREADTLLERAREARVEEVLAIGSGYGLGANAAAVSLAERQTGVWASVGVHPHDALDWGPMAQQAVTGWLHHRRVVAVGECGLDYYHAHAPRELQLECLRGQIRLAREHDLPLVIHVRPSESKANAFEDLLRIFDEEGAEQCGGVIHCFTGDLLFAQACLQRDFDISFSGILTFKNAHDLREVAAAVPLDRLLIETDSPLLAPVPHRGRRNEPAWVVCVAECLARIHAIPCEQIADQTRQRTHARFRLGALK